MGKLGRRFDSVFSVNKNEKSAEMINVIDDFQSLKKTEGKNEKIHFPKDE